MVAQGSDADGYVGAGGLLACEFCGVFDAGGERECGLEVECEFKIPGTGKVMGYEGKIVG